MAPLLTICVPTVSHRAGLLSRLLWSIGEQAQGWEGKFEVLVHKGDQTAYGTKLNRMFAEAAGTWVMDAGDDDWLASSYLQTVLPILEQHEPDYLGYKFLYLENGLFQYEISHRGDITGWPSRNLRGVCQKCPIRTEIARSVPFANHYTADRDWSLSVGEKVKTHIFVDRALYYYDHYEAEMLGTAPDHRRDAWVDTNRVGTWSFDFPWWEGPRYLSSSSETKSSDGPSSARGGAGISSRGAAATWLRRLRRIGRRSSQ